MSKTGFPPAVIRQVLDRSDGRCEAATEVCTAQGVDLQHRRARGAGGSKRPDTNIASNALVVCRPCHHLIETNPILALKNGWRVPQAGDPQTVPVLWFGKWVYLTADGSLLSVEVNTYD